MTVQKTGRNEPCPCGSQKKFKNCCQRLAAEQTKQRASADLEVLMDAAKVLHTAGELTHAKAMYQEVLDADAQHPEALHMMALTLGQLGDPVAAADMLARALALQPTAEMHYNLGCMQQETQNYQEAAKSYHKAVELKPGYALAWGNLGAAFQQLGFGDASMECFKKAREIQPDLVSAHNNLGLAFSALGNSDKALDSFRSALALDPDDYLSEFGIAQSKMALRSFGNDGDDPISLIRKSLVKKPSYYNAHANLIYVMDMDARFDTAALQAERRVFDERHCAPLALKQKPHANAPAHQRRLKVGYVSADYKEHSASKGFGGMLTHFDATNFEVFAYYNGLQYDAITELFKSKVDHWHPIVDLSDDQLVDLIRSHQIDILVDLSAFSNGGRLQVFAQRPAPIQITAWGYAASTGMKAMDVFFADPVVVPAEEKHLFTEQVYDLPSVIPYFNPKTFPDVGPLPALSGSCPGITFGAFNRLAKVSDTVLATWAEILRVVPSSQLVIKAGDLNSDAARQQVLSSFEAQGVAADRIKLIGPSDWLSHTAAYNQIDICLDPFPLGGGITTLEGLRMGVPVVAMHWPTIAGRLSSSILTTLGMTDWIAGNRADYVAIAARMAQDLTKLADLRAGLRARFDKSVLGDTAAYVGAAEQAYRALWRQWCDRQTTVSLSAGPELEQGVLRLAEPVGQSA